MGNPITIQMGRLSDARATFQRGHSTSGATVFQAALGAVHAVSGDRAEAARVIRELSTRAGYVPAYYTVAIYAKMGDFENAMVWFEKAYQERSEPMLYLASDPWVDELRGRPEFDDLLTRIGLPQPSPGRSATIEDLR